MLVEYKHGTFNNINFIKIIIDKTKLPPTLGRMSIYTLYNNGNAPFDI